MKALIEALRELQDVDRQRIEAERERRAITERVDQIQQMAATLQEELAEKREKLKEAERWYHERERELKEDNEKIKRAQARLNQLTKAKEYAAVQREIEFLRRSNQQKEEEILKLLAVMDEFKAAVADEQKKLDEMQKDLEAERTATAARVEELDRRLAQLEADHARFEHGIPPNVLQRYRRIQQAWQGTAVVPVNSKGSCGGCHRQVPPQMYNILLRQNSLESCPYCNRFIYVDVEAQDDVAHG